MSNTFYDTGFIALTSYFGGQREGQRLQITIYGEQHGKIDYVSVDLKGAKKLRDALDEWICKQPNKE